MVSFMTKFLGAMVVRCPGVVKLYANVVSYAYVLQCVQIFSPLLVVTSPVHLILLDLFFSTQPSLLQGSARTITTA